MKVAINFNKEKIGTIAKKYHLKFVILFGSKARLEPRNIESDFDIAVFAGKETDYKFLLNLFSEFSDLFPGENVDVRSLDTTNLLFRYQVVKHGVLLFGDKKKYLMYKLNIIKQYVDDGQKYFPFLEDRLNRQQKYLEEQL